MNLHVSFAYLYNFGNKYCTDSCKSVEFAVSFDQDSRQRSANMSPLKAYVL
jgi:hypothetical protein